MSRYAAARPAAGRLLAAPAAPAPVPAVVARRRRTLAVARVARATLGVARREGPA